MPAAFKACAALRRSKVPKFHVPGEVRIHNTILNSVAKSLPRSFARHSLRQHKGERRSQVAPSLFDPLHPSHPCAILPDHRIIPPFFPVEEVWKIFPDQWNYQKIFNFDAIKHIQKTSLCGTLN
jgi:hypothetical protein